MKINYADRRNDNNILKKRFKIIDSCDHNFEGKIGLIQLEKVNKNFVAKRPNGISEIVIDNDYKIMTYFPKRDSYCCSIMYDKNNKILQWYFDILKENCQYVSGIPYGEDMYLDVIALPNGDFYTIDEEDLKDALDKRLITISDFTKAYISMNNVEQMLKNNFDNLYNFTKESFETLKNIRGE